MTLEEAVMFGSKGALALFLAGLILIAGGLLDGNRWISDRDNWLFLALIGRKGSRAIYVFVGIVFIVVALLVRTGTV